MYTPNDDTFEDNLEGLLSDALGVVKKVGSVAMSLSPSHMLLNKAGLDPISMSPTAHLLGLSDKNKGIGRLIQGKGLIGGLSKKTSFSKIFANQPSHPRSKSSIRSRDSVMPARESTKISLDPSINSALKEINNRLKRAEIQREATSEHNSINRQDNFERNVIKKLSLIDAATNRLPLGTRRDKVLRIILKA